MSIDDTLEEAAEMSEVSSDQADARPVETRLRKPSALGRIAGRAWIALVVLLLIAAGVLAVLSHRMSSQVADGEEARTVASDHVAKLLSYTPATVTSDLRTELPWLGGAFRSEYEKLVQDTIAPAASKAGITVSAKAVSAGLESIDGDKATVLLFINVDTSSKEVKTPQLAGSRVRVTMEREGGHWLITQFTPLAGATFEGA